MARVNKGQLPPLAVDHLGRHRGHPEPEEPASTRWPGPGRTTPKASRSPTGLGIDNRAAAHALDTAATVHNIYRVSSSCERPGFGLAQVVTAIAAEPVDMEAPVALKSVTDAGFDDDVLKSDKPVHVEEFVPYPYGPTLEAMQPGGRCR